MSDSAALLPALVIGTREIEARELYAAVEALQPEQFLALLRGIIQAGKADNLREILDALEIMSTPSAFHDPDKVTTMEAVAEEYAYSWWLEQTGKDVSRESMIEYWDFFMLMSSERGLDHGDINVTGSSTNLWKATGTLAKKMVAAPRRYDYLPAILINNPEQVAQALAAISDPKAFLEVLTGEAWEDMVMSPNFLAAFSRTNRKDAEGALASIMLALQA